MAKNRDRGIQPDKLVSDGSGITLTQCMSCKHWVKGSWGCNAFPNSIPHVIRDNDFDHREPYPGEVDGIRYEPRRDVDPEYLDRLYAALDEVTPHT